MDDARTNVVAPETCSGILGEQGRHHGRVSEEDFFGMEASVAGRRADRRGDRDGGWERYESAGGARRFNTEGTFSPFSSDDHAQ